MADEPPDDDTWAQPDIPTIEVYWEPPEPVVLYGPDGAVLVSWTPPVGFARALTDQ